jgi:hypothetical protein
VSSFVDVLRQFADSALIILRSNPPKPAPDEDEEAEDDTPQ